MKDLKNNLLSNFSKIVILLFALFNLKLIGQINIDSYEKKFGDGITTLKKKINIAFTYNETTDQYFAKVSHKYEQLYLGNEGSKGLIQVPFNNFQKLNLEKARYYKLDSIGNKKLIENVKVKYADVKDYYIDNIFYSDLKVKQFNCSVDLQEEYILNYSYNVKYNDLKFLTSFYFQSANEAVEEVEISIKKNPNVQLSIFEFNLDNIIKTEDDSHIKFKGKNLKRFKPLATSVSGSYYLPHVVLSVAEVKTKKEVTSILKTTDDLYSWYNSLINDLKPNEEELKKLAKSIVGDEPNNALKIEKIFKWVQSNIQYVAFENGIAGFKPTEANKVASLKYGDCKGMANLLVNLLKSQGFDARHTWVGTRSKNYTYKMPSLVVDNHMICALNFENKFYYLDATSKSTNWNKIPGHLEGKEVLVANNNTYIVNTLAKSNPNDNKFTITGKMDLNKKVPEVNLQIKLTGHFYRDFLSAITYASVKTRKHIPYYFLSNYLDGIKVKNISLIQTSNETVTITLSGSYNNVAFGTKKVVFPFLDLLVYPRIAKQNTSNYIDYPHIINSQIEIYNAGKLPKENYISKQIGGNDYNAFYFTEKNNGKFIVQQKLLFNVLHTSLDENTSWNTFYDKVNSFNNQPVSYD